VLPEGLSQRKNYNDSIGIFFVKEDLLINHIQSQHATWVKLHFEKGKLSRSDVHTLSQVHRMAAETRWSDGASGPPPPGGRAWRIWRKS
jgi:hypothetical protein